MTTLKPPRDEGLEMLASRAAAWLHGIPTIVGVGVDLVHVATVSELLESGGRPFLNDTWTRQEQNQTAGDSRRLAGRWAVKEAVMKALNHGLGEISPLEIQIYTARSGAMNLRLNGAAASIASRAGVSGWHVSVAYDDSWAIGVAVAIHNIPIERSTNGR
jgi:holo-[acyl-carrier protein] synthase